MSDLPDDAQYEQGFEHQHVDGAIIISFGQVHTGREALAVETFTEVSRYLGKLLADEKISSFKPYFFADGLFHDMSGFFVLDGHREPLDALRRDEEFVKVVLRAGAAVANVRVHTMVAGSEAGRLVNMYREIRRELGFL